MKNKNVKVIKKAEVLEAETWGWNSDEFRGWIQKFSVLGRAQGLKKERSSSNSSWGSTPNIGFHLKTYPLEIKYKSPKRNKGKWNKIFQYISERRKIKRSLVNTENGDIAA